jgi:protein-disulfide isomerase
MNKLSVGIAITAILGGVALAGCQQDQKRLETKVDDRTKSVAELKEMVAKGGGGGAGARAPRPARPQADPAKTYAVPVEGDPFSGPADAKITIVKGYEYACPFCEKVRPTLDELQKKYPNDVRVVYKQFIVHPQVATAAALAVCAAHKQGKFKKMDELVWTEVFGKRQFDEAAIEGVAKQAGLDINRYKADIKGECQAFIQKDQAELAALGVGATPAFFINGRFLSGAQPLPKFEELIQQELKKADERIAAGTSPANYYNEWVIGKGLKKLDAPAEAPVPAK